MVWNPITHVTDQFKTPKVEDFPDTYQPLSETRRMSSAGSGGNEKFGAKGLPSTGDSSDDEKHNAKDAEAGQGGGLTFQQLRQQLDEEAAAFGVGSMYDRKSKIINMAITDIGMGKYQWGLFVLCGFGWFADNFWLQGVALTLPLLEVEFGISETTSRFTTLSLFVGLTIGASFWGIAADVIGRRLAFNTTLFLAAIFGMASAGPDTWVGVCALYACVGLGVGGNLPVDGALFLEFLPFANGALLTGLSVWWPVGSLIGSLFAWGYVVGYACDTPAEEPCTFGIKGNNAGWRYLLITLGAVTFLQWFARFFLFHLYESPKFLLSKGRQEEAVAVVHAVAYKNGKKTWLTSELMDELAGVSETTEKTKLSNTEIIKHSLSKFSVDRFAPLFAGWKIGLTTGLLWVIWAAIGMGYPLFNAFLPQYIGASTASTNETYRNYAITNVVGVPGSIMAIYFVNVKYLGRKGTMAIATALTGVFICLFTTSKDSGFQLGMTCMEAFFQNIAYGVLYAYTPEVFPANVRGTATGMSSTFNRIAGLCAPLVGIYAGGADPKTPIYASAALFFIAFLAMCALPIETRGKQSL